MSEDSGDNEATSPAPPPKVADDKRHLFSMFIDLGTPPARCPPRLSSSLQRLNQDDDTADVTLRRRKHSGDAMARTRHSWNLAPDTAPNLFTFDDPPAPQPADESCSTSVTSGDHGYQSLPVVAAPQPLPKSGAQSSNSVGSNSFHEDDVVTLRSKHHREPSVSSDSFSKDSVESFAESLSKRSSSVSDAEEVTYIHLADKAEMRRRNTSFNNVNQATYTFVRKASDPVLARDERLFIDEEPGT